MDADPYTKLLMLTRAYSENGNAREGIEWLRVQYDRAAKAKDSWGMDAAREVASHYVSPEPYFWLK
jgi:hypothetical protein